MGEIEGGRWWGEGRRQQLIGRRRNIKGVMECEMGNGRTEGKRENGELGRGKETVCVPVGVLPLHPRYVSLFPIFLLLCY